MTDRPLFEAYREYVGVESVESLNASTLNVWACGDCDVRVPVVASDPQAYGPVLCPECGRLCEKESESQMTNNRCKR